MKKAMMIAGSVFLLSGTFLFGMVYLAIANYAPQLTGWSDPPGRFSTLLENTMQRVPLNVSIVFMVIGAILIAVAIYLEAAKEQEWKKYSESVMNEMDIEDKDVK